MKRLGPAYEQNSIASEMEIRPSLAKAQSEVEALLRSPINEATACSAMVLGLPGTGKTLVRNLVQLRFRLILTQRCLDTVVDHVRMQRPVQTPQCGGVGGTLATGFTASRTIPDCYKKRGARQVDIVMDEKKRATLYVPASLFVLLNRKQGHSDLVARRSGKSFVVYGNHSAEVKTARQIPTIPQSFSKSIFPSPSDLVSALLWQLHATSIQE